MIEVLVSPNNIGIHGRMGDIVAAGLTGMPWGRFERTCFWVAEWEDAEIEARLMALKTDRCQWPVIGSPYRGTEPTVDVCMLPTETWIPQRDEAGNLALGEDGKPLPPTRDATPVTMDAILTRMPAGRGDILRQKAGEFARTAGMAAGSMTLVREGSSPGIEILPADPVTPDLSEPRTGPPLRSRVRLDYVRWTAEPGDKVTLAELAGKVTFDGQRVEPADVRAGMPALVARLTPAAEPPAAEPPAEQTQAPPAETPPVEG